jgi:hypothetical protein
MSDAVDQTIALRMAGGARAICIRIRASRRYGDPGAPSSDPTTRDALRSVAIEIWHA